MARHDHVSLLHAGWLAAALFVLALLAMGAATPGYVHADEAVSNLGAVGAPHARWWNLLGFVVPGLLIALFAYALAMTMRDDGIGAAGRIGLWLLCFSGLAFAGGGIWAYDLTRPFERASQLHVAMLTLTMVAFLPAAALVAVGLRGRSNWRALVSVGPVLALLTAASIADRAGNFIPMLETTPGYGQRITLALYFAWMVLASWVALRRPQGGRPPTALSR